MLEVGWSVAGWLGAAVVRMGVDERCAWRRCV